MKAKKNLRRRVAKIAFSLCAVALLFLGGALVWAYWKLRLSLPTLDGELVVEGITDEVVIDRDKLGIPTIKAKNRLDLAFATGYAHAQDRFFQMDLLRRNAAGELSELLGKALLERDRSARTHQFRARAQRKLATQKPHMVRLLDAYSQGVNAGLESLKAHPFEYIILGQEPAPWKREDCLLVVYSMFMDLQWGQFENELQRGLFKDQVPDEVFDFLYARGGKWDAPLQGKAFEVPPIPSSELFDPRSILKHENKQYSLAQNSSEDFEPAYSLGSNNWAVAGSHTADGRAILANDMHLRIQVPHIWYRASFARPDPEDETQTLQMTGVSLPGTPAMIVGSNGKIAWGFTNTEADWLDIVIVEKEESNPYLYKTPFGSQPFERHIEVIKVRGEQDVEFEVISTIWGPLIDTDHKQRPLACRWVAHDVEGVNLGLLDFETCRSLEHALTLANRAGTPHQNFVVADDQGRIAWTIIGQIPRRVGHDGFVPRSWADGSCRWDGYLSLEEYPRIIDPPAGRIWTANARVVSDEFYKILGDSGYDRGARQQQIRDSLLAMEKATEQDMLRLQLDDRSLFHQPWKDLILRLLGNEEYVTDINRRAIRDVLYSWDGRTSIDSVGYRVVWSFRNRVISGMSSFIGRVASHDDDRISLMRHRRIEEPFWKILEERPDHYLDPQYKDWDDFLLKQLDEVIRAATAQGKSLSEFTWGQLNTTHIQHPFSTVVPTLSRWLDMPKRPLQGAWSDLPRIQTPGSGASQRMAVSPGREKDAYMHMPCGQSGHPLSPHYSDSHSAWEQGNATPFLPGETIHSLRLKPGL